jgi:hypothetical protein
MERSSEQRNLLHSKTSILIPESSADYGDDEEKTDAPTGSP